MKKVFLDCDVILDLLLKRSEFVEDAQILFARIEKGRFKGLTSGLALANIFYILQKLISKKEAFIYIRKLSLLLSVSTINQKVIDGALSSSFIDFEDSVQYYSAMEAKVDYFITRNIGHYKKSAIAIFTPSQINSITSL